MGLILLYKLFQAYILHLSFLMEHYTPMISYQGLFNNGHSGILIFFYVFPRVIGPQSEMISQNESVLGTGTKRYFVINTNPLTSWCHYTYMVSICSNRSYWDGNQKRRLRLVLNSFHV